MQFTFGAENFESLFCEGASGFEISGSPQTIAVSRRGILGKTAFREAFGSLNSEILRAILIVFTFKILRMNTLRVFFV